MNYRELQAKALEEMADSDNNKFYQSWLDTVISCQQFSKLLKKAEKKGKDLTSGILKGKIWDCTDTLKCFSGNYSL